MKGIKSFFSKKNIPAKSPLSARGSSTTQFSNENHGKKKNLQGIMYKYGDKVICLQGNISSKDKILSSALRTICKLEEDLESTKKDTQSFSSSVAENNRTEEVKCLLEEKESEKQALISLQSNLESELGSCREQIRLLKSSMDKQSLKVSELKSKLRAKKYEISILEKKINLQETTVDFVNGEISQSFESQHLDNSWTQNNKLQEALHRSEVIALENEQLKIRLEKLTRKNEILTKKAMEKKTKPGNSVLELQDLKNKLELINVKTYDNPHSLYKIRTELETSYKLFVSEFTQTYDQTQKLYSVHPNVISNMDKSINNLLTFIQDRIDKTVKGPQTSQIQRKNTF